MLWQTPPIWSLLLPLTVIVNLQQTYVKFSFGYLIPSLQRQTLKNIFKNGKAPQRSEWIKEEAWWFGYPEGFFDQLLIRVQPPCSQNILNNSDLLPKFLLIPFLRGFVCSLGDLLFCSWWKWDRMEETKIAFFSSIERICNGKDKPSCVVKLAWHYSRHPLGQILEL